MLRAKTGALETIKTVLDKNFLRLSKAGFGSLVLESSASILAACNPNDNDLFNTNMPLIKQIGLDETGLSRFDYIFIEPNGDEEQDKKLAKRIVLFHSKGLKNFGIL